MVSKIAILGNVAELQVPIFFAQLLLLILVGRLLGEWMQRLGQPAVMGQLLAGIILGPSLLGSIWPAAQHLVFPANPSQRSMLNAVSELGVLLLLLLTGMETDLALVKRVRRTAAITSAVGIVIPFICGYLLGKYLPESMLPDPNRRLLTSLFVAAALSISSVKIVAAVLSEVGFLRRNLGQVILAAAILDDTIGWTILALISGLASHGRIMIGPVLFSVAGTVIFLVLSFTVGSRLVSRIIRWTNDHFISEMPVISVILVIMIALALTTNFIGVHTVLGAFVSGILIGQSPILTRHIEEELRGFIVALFMPVFFGVAGLSIDLKVLIDPRLLELAVIFIGIASIGKLGGCYLGSRMARLNHPEGLAVGFAMNARGSTEVILATIGLTMGVLNQQLFTVIVIMAVVTTICMPPLLRWALARVPMREEEKIRMEKESAEEKDSMPKLERVLVGVDGSANGRLASQLAGWFIGTRNLTTTVLDVGARKENEPPRGESVLEAAREATSTLEAIDQSSQTGNKDSQSHPVEAAAKSAQTERIPVGDLVSVLPVIEHGDSDAQVILAEAKNGYGLLFIGLGTGRKKGISGFSVAIETVLRNFNGPVAIPLHPPAGDGFDMTSLNNILVPLTGADYSRFGAEVAVAIAKGCAASITALHISAPAAEHELVRHSSQARRTGRAILADITALGVRETVPVTGKSVVSPAKAQVILDEAGKGAFDLIVLGTKAWTGRDPHIGETAAALIASARCPLLIVNS